MAMKLIYLCNLLVNMELQQEDYTEEFKGNTVCIEWSNQVLCWERAGHVWLSDLNGTPAQD
jgi:hypothetical protein